MALLCAVADCSLARADCPAGSENYRYCPKGTYSPIEAKRESLAEDCPACLPGQYSDVGGAANCSQCAPGYICQPGEISVGMGLGSTTSTPANRSLDGYPCPAGYYCPAGAFEITPCAAGRYSQRERLAQASECELCPAGTFNDLEGETGCKPCGASSTADEGALACKCIGDNRAFQSSDGSCLCKPGFVFIDETFQESSDDSKLNCQEKVFDRCETGFTYDATGKCVNPDSYDCTADCDGGSGTFIRSFGFCECANLADADDVCDANCRSKQLVTSLSADELGETVFVIQNRSCCASSGCAAGDGCSVSLPISELDSTQIQGSMSCAPGASCNSQTISMSGDGFKGLYDVQPDVYSEMLGVDVVELFTRLSGGRRRLQVRRHLQAAANASEPPAVANPLVCLALGDGIFFDISSGTYPCYQDTSLINTNAEFDYGAFRQLHNNMLKTSPPTNFYFAFTQPGTYVLANRDTAASGCTSSQTTIVRVMGSSEVCPQDAGMVSATSANLVTLGVSKDTESIVRQPDWHLIKAVLISLTSFVVGLVVIMYIYKERAQRKRKQEKPRYRDSAQGKKLGGLASQDKVGIESRQQGGVDGQAVAGAGGDHDAMFGFGGEGGDMDAQNIIDKLDEQTVLIVSELEKEIAEIREALEAGIGSAAMAQQLEDRLQSITQGRTDASPAAPAAGENSVNATRSRHQQERDDLHDRLAERAQEEVESLHQELEQQKEQVLNSEQDRFQERIDAATDPAEKAAIEKERDRDLQRLEELLNAEEEASQESLMNSLQEQLDQEMQRLEAKQRLELDGAQLDKGHKDQLDALAAAQKEEEAALEAEIKAEQDALDDEIKAQLTGATALQDVDWDSEKNKILSDYEQEAANLDREMDEGRKRNQQKLQERLRKAKEAKQRKAEKAAQLAQKHNAAEADIVQEGERAAREADMAVNDSQIAAMDQKIEEKMKSLAETESPDDAKRLLAQWEEEQRRAREEAERLRRKQKDALEARIAARRNKMKQRHEDEHSECAEQIEEDTARQEASLQKEADAEAAAADATADDKLQSLEDDLNRRQSEVMAADLSDQERDRLMKELELERESMRHSLESSRAQQKRQLEEKLRAKKEALRAAQAQKQKDEDAVLELAQQEEVLADESQAELEEQDVEVQCKANVAAELEKVAAKLDSAKLDGIDDEEERRRLMEQSKREYEEMQANLAAQKAERRRKLADQLAEKKRRLAEAQRQELEQEGLEGNAEAAAVVAEQAVADQQEKARIEETLADQTMAAKQQSFEQTLAGMDGVPEAEKQNLMAQYKKEMAELEAMRQRERDRQRENMKKRLEEKTKQLRKKQEQELQDAGAGKVATQQAIEREDLEKEAAHEMEDMVATQAEESAAALDGAKQDLDAKLAGAASEEDRQSLLAEYEEEKRRLLQQMNADQQDRRARLQAKIDAKKRALRKSQEKEIAEVAPEAADLVQEQAAEQAELEAAVRSEAAAEEQAMRANDQRAVDQGIAAVIQKVQDSDPDIAGQCEKEMDEARRRLREEQQASKAALKAKLQQRASQGRRSRVEDAAADADAGGVVDSVAAVELELAAEQEDYNAQMQEQLESKLQLNQENAINEAANDEERLRLQEQFEEDQRNLKQQMAAKRSAQEQKMQDRLAKKKEALEKRRKAALAAQQTAAEAADSSSDPSDDAGAATAAAPERVQSEEEIQAELQQEQALERARLEAELAEEKQRLLAEDLKKTRAQALAKEAAAASSENLTQQAREDNEQIQKKLAREKGIRERALHEKLARKKAALAKKAEQATAAAQQEYLETKMELDEKAEEQARSAEVDVNELVAFVEEQTAEPQGGVSEEKSAQEIAEANALIEKEAALEEELLQTYADLERKKLQMQADSEAQLAKFKAELEADQQAAMEALRKQNDEVREQKQAELEEARMAAQSGDAHAAQLVQKTQLEMESLDRALKSNEQNHKKSLEDRLKAKQAKKQEAAEAQLEKQQEQLELAEEKKIVELTTQLITEKEESAAAEQEAAEAAEAEREAEEERQREQRRLEEEHAAAEAAAKKELDAKMAAEASDAEKRRLKEEYEQDKKEKQAQLEASRDKNQAKLQRRLDAKLEQKKRDRELKRQAEKDKREAERKAEAERAQQELEEAQKTAELERKHLEEQQRAEAEAEAERERAQREADEQRVANELAQAQAAAAKAASEAVAAAADEQERRKIMEDHERAVKETKEEMERKRSSQRQALEARLEKKRQQKRAKLKQKQELEMRQREEEQASKGVSGSTARNMMKHAEGLVSADALNQVKNNASREANLQSQIADARARGDDAAAQKLQEDLEAELRTAQDGLSDARAAKTADAQSKLADKMGGIKSAQQEEKARQAKLQAELEALHKAVKDLSPQQIYKAIQGVMSKRHDQETKQMATSHIVGSAKRVQAAVDALSAELAATGVDPESDDATARLDAVRKETEAAVDAENKQERQELRQRQMGEIKDAMHRMCPEHAQEILDKEQSESTERAFQTSLGAEKPSISSLFGGGASPRQKSSSKFLAKLKGKGAGKGRSISEPPSQTGPAAVPAELEAKIDRISASLQKIEEMLARKMD